MDPYGQQPYGYGYQQPYGYYAPPPPRFDFGTVLGKGFTIFFKNLPAFLLMSTIVFLPLIVYGTMAEYPPIKSADPFDLAMHTMRFALVLMAAGLVLQPLLTAAVTYAVVEEMSGRHASIGKCLSIGLKRLPAAFAVSLLVMICTALGLLALIVGAFVVMCMLYVAIPVSVIERPGIFRSLSRSAELTRGYRWWILLLALIVGGASGILSTMLETVLVDTEEIKGVEVITPGAWTTYVWLNIVTSVITAALGATMSAVTYVSLRTGKDGVPAQDLSKVFE
jgi:hypothetical protein